MLPSANGIGRKVSFPQVNLARLTAEGAANGSFNVRRTLQSGGGAVPCNFAQMMAPGVAYGDVEGLARTVAETVFIAFRAESQIHDFQFFGVAGVGDDARKQAVAGRIFFPMAVEGGLVPEPAFVKLEAEVPGHGSILNSQLTQSDDAAAVESAGEIFQKDAAFSGREAAGAARGGKARDVGIGEFREGRFDLLPGAKMSEGHGTFALHGAEIAAKLFLSVESGL